MSEASALLLSAANVRQTHSMGDLIPAVPTPPPPPPRLTPPTSTCSLPPKSATLGPTTSWVAANDIDCDLFGAAFDAIRNQSSRGRFPYFYLFFSVSDKRF
uniref:Uncharacterized protein n=1 Tax=Mesocestoides corti TaxID=53468 RepID=A0A5K3FB73_MESCO